MLRFVSILFLAVLSIPAFAGDTLKIADSAVNKVKKTPIGTAIETGPRKSTIQIVIPAAGVDAANFTSATTIKLHVSEGSGSSTDYDLDLTFGQDTKYKAGAKSIKIDEAAIGGVTIVKQNVLRSTQVKIGKDSITISIKNNVNSIYAQMYLNYGSLGVVQFPEGKGTATRNINVTSSVGTFAKNLTGVTYNASYSNKPSVVGGVTYWNGSAKASASAQ